MIENSHCADLIEFEPYFRPGFLPWLVRNEAIYKQFETQALAAIEAGWQHFSARTIVEEIRHYTRLREGGACSFKVDGNMAPDLARAFVVRHPKHALLWEYRRPDAPQFIEAVRVAA